MKPFNGIPDYRKKEDRQPEEIKLVFEPCCVCNKEITTGHYGKWGTGGTCSKSCEALRQDTQLYLMKD